MGEEPRLDPDARTVKHRGEVAEAVGSFWRYVATGSKVDDAELRHRGFPERFWGEMRRDAFAVHKERDGGTNNGAGRRLALELKQSWHSRLIAEDWDPPSTRPNLPDRFEEDPRKLSEGLPRW